ncbi:MAG: hypothetical protein H7257_09375 [Taibaiella sp.]|nr:hypothetical protein [Taibaiella sp.]
MLKKMKLTQREAKVRLMSVLMLLVLAVMPLLSIAQPGFETADGGGGVDTGVTDVPINGGTALLIAAGVLFGVYRLYKMVQSKNTLALAK